MAERKNIMSKLGKLFKTIGAIIGFLAAAAAAACVLLCYWEKISGFFKRLYDKVCAKCRRNAPADEDAFFGE